MRQIVNKKNITKLYIVMSILGLAYIIINKEHSFESLIKLFHLFIDKNFLLSFVVYTAILTVYVFLIKYALEKFFNAFIKLIGEDYTLILTYLNKKQTVLSLVALLIARKFNTIVSFIIQQVVNFFPDTGQYLLTGQYTKIILTQMDKSIELSNNILLLGIFTILSTIGTTMYLGTVKKMKIVKYQIIEPTSLLVRSLPYMSILIFVFYVLLLSI